jgi:hypothetical protein
MNVTQQLQQTMQSKKFFDKVKKKSYNAPKRVSITLGKRFVTDGQCPFYAQVFLL